MTSSDDQSNDARRDFGRLWGAYAVSAAGSAIGTGALPLVAVLALEVTAFQVSSSRRCPRSRPPPSPSRWVAASSTAASAPS